MKKDFKFRFSVYYLAILVAFAVIVPLIPSFDPNSFNPNMILEPQAPSFGHILGTDDLGRDTLLRCIYGARVSLAVGFVAVLVMLVVGILIGILSGYLGGVFDEIIMRLVDIFMAIPTIFLILTIQVLLKPSIYNVMLVIGLTSWTGVCRLVRAEVLSVKERLFITAARARGFGHIRILFKHLLPHTLSPVIVAGMLSLGYAILTESVLSFLGLGVQPPNASWGNMLENSLSYMIDAPWLAIAPGLFITLTVLSLNFMGDALRSKLSVRQ